MSDSNNKKEEPTPMEVDTQAADEGLPPVVKQPNPIEKVIVHPLVLLSVVDHFNRLDKVSVGSRRCVGVLLGSRRADVLDISNSFALPFEEDSHDRSVWFLDHDYLENMFNMFKKVNARERIVGWYHSAPRLCQNDIAINELFRKFCSNPVLVVVKIDPEDSLPTEAYVSVEEVHDDGRPPSKTWNHLKSEIGAEEAEEVGVEHLLRDIKDSTIGTLSQRIQAQLTGLKGLHRQLKEINLYLDEVAAKKLPVNHQIVYKLQDMLNLLPDMSLSEFVRSVYIQTNDQSLVIYLSTLIRSILALHDLINNKLQNRETEREESLAKEGGDKKPSTSDATPTKSGDEAVKAGDKESEKKR